MLLIPFFLSLGCSFFAQAVFFRRLEGVVGMVWIKQGCEKLWGCRLVHLRTRMATPMKWAYTLSLEPTPTSRTWSSEPPAILHLRLATVMQTC